MKYLALIFLILLTSSACKKRLHKTNPEFIGEWVHYSENEGFHNLYIQKNGRGTQWGENEHGNNVDTQGRGWFVRNDVLHFSRFYNNAEEDVFTIDLYPQEASTTIALQFDTIPAGVTYMILNTRHYRKFND